MPTNYTEQNYNSQAATREEILRERKHRKALALRRKRKQQRLLIVGIVSLIIIVVGIILIAKSCSGSDNKQVNSANAVLNGTYVYDMYTEYEFDGKSRGCMCLETLHYEFSYDIASNTLSLDFDDPAVHDCSYILTVGGSSITIVGGEGTTGGTYTLTKK